MTTDSDSEYSYVANLAGFDVIREIVIVIKIIYTSNSYSNNGNKIVIIVKRVLLIQIVIIIIIIINKYNIFIKTLMVILHTT